MTKYLKYILKNKNILFFYIGILLFYSIFNIYGWTHLEGEDKLGFIIFLILFDLIALPMALYQPYKEFKDVVNN